MSTTVAVAFAAGFIIGVLLSGVLVIVAAGLLLRAEKRSRVYLQSQDSQHVH
jgi:uncharacterized membrane protein YciS (DUF1049 family)